MKAEISNHHTQKLTAIFLVGFMASGKTTVGAALAGRLNRRFIDLDELIVEQAGCSIAELIQREGEERFRQMETEVLKKAAMESAVIAPGGGAITRDENREFMLRSGVTVWLDAPFELCWRRIRQDAIVRPLAPNETVARDRYQQRLPLYRQASFRVPVTETMTPDEIAESIALKLSYQISTQ